MRFLRDVSLKWKLMVIIMLISSVALMLACAAFVIYEVILFRKDVVDDLTVKAEVIGSPVRAVHAATPGTGPARARARDVRGVR